MIDYAKCWYDDPYDDETIVRWCDHVGEGLACGDLVADLNGMVREIKRLRQALGDSARSLEMIAHRRGWDDHDDFVANVRPYAASRELAARNALLKECE